MLFSNIEIKSFSENLPLGQIAEWWQCNKYLFCLQPFILLAWILCVYTTSIGIVINSM